ncbi:predicted protein [Histoplasma capsulatum G186AR]|uniref:Uncharacterized protein n=1 Tax=Ajellomyces capsulatus (strain G186AR / H82 / ATCC MYA-2454 / RMSCC 2432) TaxID=447093 RepID=C0ND67_AJECG|nr:uncharacterized protein HCBG_01063 [Histoplasma capsulatum G186AR]EEH11608.1 predicted protein [Histoplasma capsulatum G186AR]
MGFPQCRQKARSSSRSAKSEEELLVIIPADTLQHPAGMGDLAHHWAAMTPEAQGDGNPTFAHIRPHSAFFHGCCSWRAGWLAGKECALQRHDSQGASQKKHCLSDSPVVEGVRGVRSYATAVTEKKAALIDIQCRWVRRCLHSAIYLSHHTHQDTIQRVKPRVRMTQGQDFRNGVPQTCPERILGDLFDM